MRFKAKIFGVAAIVASLMPLCAAAANIACESWSNARDKWLSDMTTVGEKLGESLNPSKSQPKALYGQTYYDTTNTFFEIADYTGKQMPWRQYAEWARLAYVEGYLEPARWGASGYWRFPHGLYRDFAAKGPTTLAQLERLRDTPALSQLSEYVGDYDGNLQSMSREIAYALQANIAAERAGAPRKADNGRDRPAVFVGWMSQHFLQWETGGYLAADKRKGEARFAPFMFGLSAHALIEFVEWEELNKRNPDAVWTAAYEPTIEQAIIRFLQWLRHDAKVRQSGRPMWLTTSDGLSTLLYEDTSTDGGGPAWELGNLVAYPYAWAATRIARRGTTHMQEAQDMMKLADQLFIGTANKAWIEGGGKFFNQSYRTGLAYLRLREQADWATCPAKGTAPRRPTGLVVR